MISTLIFSVNIINIYCCLFKVCLRKCKSKLIFWVIEFGGGRRKGKEAKRREGFCINRNYLGMCGCLWCCWCMIHPKVALRFSSMLDEESLDIKTINKKIWIDDN